MESERLPINRMTEYFREQKEQIRSSHEDGTVTPVLNELNLSDAIAINTPGTRLYEGYTVEQTDEEFSTDFLFRISVSRERIAAVLIGLIDQLEDESVDVSLTLYPYTDSQIAFQREEVNRFIIEKILSNFSDLVNNEGPFGIRMTQHEYSIELHSTKIISIRTPIDNTDTFETFLMNDMKLSMDPRMNTIFKHNITIKNTPDLYDSAIEFAHNLGLQEVDECDDDDPSATHY